MAAELDVVDGLDGEAVSTDFVRAEVRYLPRDDEAKASGSVVAPTLGLEND